MDNECNKKRNPESLLEFVMSPHFSALFFVISEEIVNGEDDQTAAWVRLGARGICTLPCLFFTSFCSAKDYLIPVLSQIGMIHKPPIVSHSSQPGFRNAQNCSSLYSMLNMMGYALLGLASLDFPCAGYLAIGRAGLSCILHPALCAPRLPGEGAVAQPGSCCTAPAGWLCPALLQLPALPCKAGKPGRRLAMGFLPSWPQGRCHCQEQQAAGMSLLSNAVGKGREVAKEGAGKPELGNAKVLQRDETKAALIQGWLCSVEGLHAMDSKSLRTVIQTDESLSPKLHGQAVKPGQGSSPQIN
ncbi:hypothetical protein EK904_005687 [Melospiza melodia maxima]|nr:hypothetical protein EK904_005687 [Melospiza melodia maxima]